LPDAANHARWQYRLLFEGVDAKRFTVCINGHLLGEGRGMGEWDISDVVKSRNENILTVQLFNGEEDASRW
jgi:hypothetical protein